MPVLMRRWPRRAGTTEPGPRAGMPGGAAAAAAAAGIGVLAAAWQSQETLVEGTEAFPEFHSGAA